MTRRNMVLLFGFGGVLLICAALFALNARPLALWAAGFRRGGETAVVLDQFSKGDTAAGSFAGLPGEPIGPFTISYGGRSALLDPAALGLTRAETATTTAGEPVYYFEYNEGDLNNAVSEAIASATPAEIADQFRGVSVDLKQNAAVISGEANLGLFWQPMAVVVTVDNANRTVDVTGIDIGGRFYSAPPAGPLAVWVETAEREGTRLLREAALIAPDGRPLYIEQVVLTETEVQVVTR